MQLRNRISNQNKHWDTKTIEIFDFKRDIYQMIWNNINLRLMSVLTGPRRVGKSTILKQIIKNLIKTQDVNPTQILFFEFSPIDTIETIWQIFEIYKKEIVDEKIRSFFIFDEIQYVDGYESVVKEIYDNNDNIKIILTGSLSLSYKRKMQDSLAGRFFSYQISYLNFNEYLKLKDNEVQNFFSQALEEKDKFRVKYYLETLNVEFKKFLEFGRFPEIVNFDDISAKSYISSVINQSLNQDVYSYFKIAKPQILNGLFNYIKDNNGGEITVNKLGSLLGASNPTVSSYLDILELMGLVYFISNSTNPLIKLNSTRKAYVNSSFSLLDSKLDIGTSYGFAVEAYVLERLLEMGKKVTFWRNRNKEVDFLIPDEKIGYEVKYRSDIPIIKYKPVDFDIKTISLNEKYPACLF